MGRLQTKTPSMYRPSLIIYVYIQNVLFDQNDQNWQIVRQFIKIEYYHPVCGPLCADYSGAGEVWSQLCWSPGSKVLIAMQCSMTKQGQVGLWFLPPGPYIWLMPGQAWTVGSATWTSHNQLGWPTNTNSGICENVMETMHMLMP